MLDNAALDDPGLETAWLEMAGGDGIWASEVVQAAPAGDVAVTHLSVGAELVALHAEVARRTDTDKMIRRM